MKLMSMTDFVLAEKNSTPVVRNFAGFTETSNYEKHSYSRIVKYAEFLSQPLKLEMFVPCDEGGNVMEAPIQMDYFHFEGRPAKYPQECYEFDLKKFEQAEEKVLFEGCYTFQQGENAIVAHPDKGAVWITWTDRVVEDLVQHKLILTENALKQIEL